MCKALKALVASVAVFALIAAFARLAVAQQADDDAAGMQILVSPSTVPSKHHIRESPLDVAGCWSGETEDNGSRTGSGFLFFVQKGKQSGQGDQPGSYERHNNRCGSYQRQSDHHIVFSQSEGKRVPCFFRRTNAK